MLNLDRVLVTGGGGILGRCIPFGVRLTRAQLDVTDEREVHRAIADHSPSAILHLATLAVAKCDIDPGLAHLVNVGGTYVVAEAARKFGIPLIYMSTALVFDTPVGGAPDEDVAPAPLNVYGRTKFIGERVVRDVQPDHLIVRASWLYGTPDSTKFLDRLPALLRAGETLRVNQSQTGSPTLIDDFVVALGQAISSERRGTLHLANEGVLTIDRFARKASELLNVPGRFEPAHTSAFAKSRRSASEALSSKHVTLRPWDEALRDFLVRG